MPAVEFPYPLPYQATTPSMPITLSAVTRDNFDDIIDLQLLDHQKDYLASNSYSIAQASFYPNYHTRAIYLGEEAIGFLMYVSLAEEGQPGDYAIYRFMIDSRHQGKGHGRHALQRALDEIRSQPGVQRILISYVPANPVAKDFYGSFGFVEIGIDEEEEMVAEIRL